MIHSRIYTLSQGSKREPSLSRMAKALAVKRVTENIGKRTAGVDREIWNTPKKKVAANELETQVRDYLATQKVEVEIGAEQIFFAQYERETLPLESTNTYCIAEPRCTGSFIERLYDLSAVA